MTSISSEMKELIARDAAITVLEAEFANHSLQVRTELYEKLLATDPEKAEATRIEIYRNDLERRQADVRSRERRLEIDIAAANRTKEEEARIQAIENQPRVEELTMEQLVERRNSLKDNLDELETEELAFKDSILDLEEAIEREKEPSRREQLQAQLNDAQADPSFLTIDQRLLDVRSELSEIKEDISQQRRFHGYSLPVGTYY